MGIVSINPLSGEKNQRNKNESETIPLLTKRKKKRKSKKICPNPIALSEKV